MQNHDHGKQTATWIENGAPINGIDLLALVAYVRQLEADKAKAMAIIGQKETDIQELQETEREHREWIGQQAMDIRVLQAKLKAAQKGCKPASVNVPPSGYPGSPSVLDWLAKMGIEVVMVSPDDPRLSGKPFAFEGKKPVV